MSDASEAAAEPNGTAVHDVVLSVRGVTVAFSGKEVLKTFRSTSCAARYSASSAHPEPASRCC